MVISFFKRSFYKRKDTTVFYIDKIFNEYIHSYNLFFSITFWFIEDSSFINKLVGIYSSFLFRVLWGRYKKMFFKRTFKKHLFPFKRLVSSSL